MTKIWSLADLREDEDMSDILMAFAEASPPTGHVYCQSWQTQMLYCNHLDSRDFIYGRQTTSATGDHGNQNSSIGSDAPDFQQSIRGRVINHSKERARVFIPDRWQKTASFAPSHCQDSRLFSIPLVAGTLVEILCNGSLQSNDGSACCDRVGGCRSHTRSPRSFGHDQVL